MEWSLDVLGKRVELFFVHDTGFSDLARDRTLVSDGLNDISGTGLTFCSDKRSTFGYPPKSLSQIPCTAYKWYFERVFVHVVLFIRGGQDLRFINIIDTNLLEDL